MDRPTIRLEIPLPRLPKSRLVRFSLKSVLLAVTLTAVGFALYTRGRDAERARHLSGHVVLTVRTTHGMETGLRRCADFPTVLELSKSSAVRHVTFGSEPDAQALWPPKIWIKRASFSTPDLEETIHIRCAGTYELPLIEPAVDLKPGDRVFVDYRKGNAVAGSAAGPNVSGLAKALEEAREATNIGVRSR